MGKLPKMKDRAPSSKSRAMRRATSPSNKLDKSLKTTIIEPKDEDLGLSVLAARSGAGIGKKQKKQKPLSRQQRLRKEKAMSRADAVVDKMEKKVVVSKKKGKIVKNRAAAWEELNGGRRPRNKESGILDNSRDAEMEDTQEDNPWEDEHEDALPRPEDALVSHMNEEPASERTNGTEPAEGNDDFDVIA